MRVCACAVCCVWQVLLFLEQGCVCDGELGMVARDRRALPPEGIGLQQKR